MAQRSDGRPVVRASDPEPVRKPTGTEWRDANGGYAWCYDCTSAACRHARVMYLRQVNAYAAQHYRPRRIVGFHF